MLKYMKKRLYFVAKMQHILFIWNKITHSLKNLMLI